VDYEPDKTMGEVNGSATNGAANPFTIALKAQLAALEEEAKTLGIVPGVNGAEGESVAFPRGRGRGRARASYRGRGSFPTHGSYGSYAYDSSFRGGGYRGAFPGAPRGRGTGSSVVRLDNRPKVVSVSGVGGAAVLGREEGGRR